MQELLHLPLRTSKVDDHTDRVHPSGGIQYRGPGMRSRYAHWTLQVTNVDGCKRRIDHDGGIGRCVYKKLTPAHAPRLCTEKVRTAE